MPDKNSKVKLGLKNLAMLPSYFEYIFVPLRKKARLRPELSPKFLSILVPNPTRKARPDLRLWSSESWFLALGFEFLFCPWPRVLCPRLHLWKLEVL